MDLPCPDALKRISTSSPPIVRENGSCKKLKVRLDFITNDEPIRVVGAELKTRHRAQPRETIDTVSEIPLPRLPNETKLERELSRRMRPMQCWSSL